MLPQRAILPLAAAALLCMLCEDAMGDWSAIYLATTAGLTSGKSAIGYAGFSAMMVLGRLAGDQVVRWLGRPRIVACGAAAAAAGMVLVVACPLATTLGFPLVGTGLSNVVPAVYSEAGRRGSTAADGVAMAATAGYGGFLAGPAAIGAISQLVGLQAGLSLLISCAIALELLSAATPKFVQLTRPDYSPSSSDVPIGRSPLLCATVLQDRLPMPSQLLRSSWPFRRSPQRNVNKIRGVRNTNHAPATMLDTNNT